MAPHCQWKHDGHCSGRQGSQLEPVVGERRRVSAEVMQRYDAGEDAIHACCATAADAGTHVANVRRTLCTGMAQWFFAQWLTCLLSHTQIPTAPEEWQLTHYPVDKSWWMPSLTIILTSHIDGDKLTPRLWYSASTVFWQTYTMMEWRRVTAGSRNAMGLSMPCR